MSDQCQHCKARGNHVMCHALECTYHETWIGRWREQQIAALKSEIEDIKESYKFVMDEKCTSDEKHCACVPPLRQMVKNAEIASQTWEADADAAHDVMNAAWKAKEKAEAERDRLRDALEAIYNTAFNAMEGAGMPEFGIYDEIAFTAKAALTSKAD